MKRHTFVLAALLASQNLLAPSFGAEAQPASPAASASAKTDPAAELAEAWQRRIPRLEYDGLPLLEVVRDWRRTFRPVNFIVPKSAEDAPVRGISLYSVTLGDILKAIELSSEGRIMANLAGPGGLAVDPVTGAPAALGPVRSNLVSFAYNPDFGMAIAPNPVICRVYSLKSYVHGRTGEARDEAIKSLSEAIGLSLRMLKNADDQVEQPEFSIHPETSLFIAVGRPKELEVVGQIIHELQASAHLAFPRDDSAENPAASSKPR